MLVASSIFLDLIKPAFDQVNLVCGKSMRPILKEACNAVKAGMAAAVIGIIVSIIQILFGIYAVIKLVRNNTEYRY